VGNIQEQLLDIMKCKNCNSAVIDHAYPPRGWAGNYSSEKVQYLLITLYPASPKDKEEKYFKNHHDYCIKDLDFLIDDVANFYLIDPNNEKNPNKRYHKNLNFAIKKLLRRTTNLKEDDICSSFLDYVWVTDLFKCSLNNEVINSFLEEKNSQGKKKKSNEFGYAMKQLENDLNTKYPLEHCIGHLYQELSYFNPKYIFAMSRLVEYELKRKQYNYLKEWRDKVFYLPHPSYPRHRDPEQKKYKEKFEEYLSDFIQNELKSIPIDVTKK